MASRVGAGDKLARADATVIMPARAALPPIPAPASWLFERNMCASSSDVVLTTGNRISGKSRSWRLVDGS